MPPLTEEKLQQNDHSVLHAMHFASILLSLCLEIQTSVLKPIELKTQGQSYDTTEIERFKFSYQRLFENTKDLLQWTHTTVWNNTKKRQITEHNTQTDHFSSHNTKEYD